LSASSLRPSNSAATASPSAAAVHDIVCDMVADKAEAEIAPASGWSDYRAVFLSAEVQDLIRSRLLLPLDGPGSAPLAGDGPASSPKKRKFEAAGGGPAMIEDASWTVCCMDGTTFSVAMPEHALVSELKRAIGRLRELAYFALELFIKDVEDALGDSRPLSSVGRVPLFLLMKAATDRLALEALFKNTGGAGWADKGGWCTDVDLDDWHKVKVDAEGRVVELGLHENCLAGSISSELQQLSGLQALSLYNNQLTGCIPTELGQLGALTHLNLQNNQLSGCIPAEFGLLVL
jgi:hypothetical protein